MAKGANYMVILDLQGMEPQSDRSGDASGLSVLLCGASSSLTDGGRRERPEAVPTTANEPVPPTIGTGAGVVS